MTVLNTEQEVVINIKMLGHNLVKVRFKSKTAKNKEFEF